MMTRPLAVFRTDADALTGMGHLIRCAALAELFDECGWDCAFAVSAASTAAAASLSRRWTILPLAQSTDAAEAAALRTQWPCGADLLIVDHYRRDREFESRCRGWARRLLVIDDLADRAHDCDVLLDQSPERVAAAYAGLVPAGTRILTGLSHALLRRQFGGLRGAALARRNDNPRARRLLISLGGSDSRNLTAAALDAAAAAAPACHIDIVLGALAPHLDEIRCRTAHNPLLHLHTGVANMGLLMAAADFGVGAAGISAWERSCLGLPSLIIVAADNQRPGAQFLAARDAALVIDESEPPSPARIAAELRRLAGDEQLRRALTGACAALCDGRGGWRTMLALLPPVTAQDTGSEVALRLAETSDALAMFRWQIAPETRRYARNPVPPSIDEHLDWYEAALADDRRLLTVLTYAGVPAGLLRFDRMAAPGAYEVSIAVAPELHGQGIGSAALALARALMPGARLVAEIDPGNTASLGLFGAAGYRRRDERRFVSAPEDIERVAS